MLENALVALFATTMLSTNSGNEVYIDVVTEMLMGKEYRTLFFVHAPNLFLSKSLLI